MAATALATSEDVFRKLTRAQIGARLAGKEITDGVHWAEQYMRDGTFKAFHMGKATTGRWYARDSELCLRARQQNGNARKFGCPALEFRVPGSGLPPFEGVLKNQEPRS